MSSLETVCPMLVILKGFLNFCLSVHDNGPVLCDRFIDGLASYKDKSGSISHKFVSGVLMIQYTNVLEMHFCRAVVNEISLKYKD